jgi:hypothetical protein
MKRSLLFSVLLFSGIGLLAQSPVSVESSVARLNQISQGSGLIPVFNLKTGEIRGSRFLNKEYTEGEVWLNKERHYGKEYKYKFDEAENTIQILTKEGKEILLLNYEIEVAKLYIDNSTVTYFRAEVPNSGGTHRLFQVLFVGKKYTFIKLPAKKLVKTDNSGGYNTGEVFQEYIPVHRYFLQVGNKPFQEIKMTKKSLLKAMPQKKKALEELFEDHEGDIMDYEIAELLQETEPKEGSN